MACKYVAQEKNFSTANSHLDLERLQYNMFARSVSSPGFAENMNVVEEDHNEFPQVRSEG